MNGRRSEQQIETMSGGKVSGAPYLRWIGPEGREQAYALAANEIILGRKGDADVVLSDPYISRHHAKLVRLDRGYKLVDLGSTHGSFINGRRVTEQRLAPGDRISLGKGRVELDYIVDSPHTLEEEATLEFGVEKSIMDLTAVLPSVYSGYSDLEKLSFLLDFQYNLGRNFSAARTFEQILASALKISGAERGFILLNSGDAFEYVVGMDGDGHTLAQSEFIQASQTVVRQVVKTGEPVFMTEGITGDLQKQDSIVAMNVRALSCVPLKWISSDSATTGVRGILYLDSTKMMHALSGLDQKILDKLALEAANVFEKVQMIETLEERRQFEQELALARETQQTLLPQSLPELESFQLYAYSQPTRHVGGDFYDFLNAESGELTGVLADVSGKGISAALLSSLLQGALDMEVRSGVEHAEALTRINRFLIERSQANRFVTLFMFHLDPLGSGSFISAGHNPAYVFRAGTQTVESLRSEHMILGAFHFAKYSSKPLSLGAGDILLVYSDGLTEAENPSGDMFGEERLIELVHKEGNLGGEHLEMKILQTVEEFTQGHAQTDDITFMLVEKNAVAS